MNSIDLKKRIEELNEVRQFSQDVKPKLSSVYSQLGWQQSGPSEIMQINSQKQFSNESNCQPNPNLTTDSAPGSSLPAKPNPKDSFLHMDLIRAYHKLASKEAAQLESIQSKEVTKIMKRKRSKQKKLYSSKRLSYKEVVRNLIEHQNEVMANINVQTNKNQQQ